MPTRGQEKARHSRGRLGVWLVVLAVGMPAAGMLLASVGQGCWLSAGAAALRGARCRRQGPPLIAAPAPGTNVYAACALYSRCSTRSSCSVPVRVFSSTPAVVLMTVGGFRFPPARGCRVQAACSVRPAPAGSRPDRARRRGVSVKAAALGVGVPSAAPGASAEGAALTGHRRVPGSQGACWGRQRAVPCMRQPSERARCRGRQQRGPGSGAAPQLACMR